MYLFYNPTPRNGCFSGIFTILLTQHPAMLRKTVGEKGYVRYKLTDEMSFSTPPSLRATSPIFCVAKHPVMLLGTAGEEFQIPTPKRYVIIRCSKYRYSHFLKNKDGMWNVLWYCESRGIESVALNSLLSLWNFEGILLFPCAAKWIGECPPGKGVKPSIENLMKSFLTSLQREQERSIR